MSAQNIIEPTVNEPTVNEPLTEQQQQQLVLANELRECLKKAEEAEEAARLKKYAVDAQRAEQLTDYVWELMPFDDHTHLQSLAQKGYYGVHVFTIQTPGYYYDGDQKHPKHPPEEVYFSSYDKATKVRGDSSSGGVPMVGLTLGYRKTRGGPPDPTTCPEGLTLVDRLNRRFEPGSFEVKTSWDHGGLHLYMVWDPEAWDKQPSHAMENSLPTPRPPSPAPIDWVNEVLPSTDYCLTGLPTEGRTRGCGTRIL
jgi:hypothetical protein